MGRLGLSAGQVIWCVLDPAVGREHGGRRPCVAVSSTAFSRATDALIIAVPCTSRDRGWANHIRLTGDTRLARPTFAITEQPRTISVARVHGMAGHVDEECLAAITRWVRTWLHAPV